MNQAVIHIEEDDDEKVDVSALLSKQVVQDICIQHHKFNFKPHKVPHQEMKGSPQTIHKVLSILEAIKVFQHTGEDGQVLTCLSYSYERDGRYGHSIESFNIKNDEWIELVISTTDYQAENFFKEDKLSREQEYVSFTQNQGAKRFSHVLVNIDNEVGSKGTFANIYLEANKGVTAHVLKRLFELILLEIKSTGAYTNLFEEVYRPDVTKQTKMDLEVRVSISPVADQTVLNKILTNDYLKIELRDKWLQETASDEVNFLEQTAEVQTFQPTGMLDAPLTAELFTTGVRNLVKKMRKDAKAKANTTPTIHLTYFEGERERTVELDLQQKLADVATKKTWLKDFMRKPITKESFIDDKLFNMITAQAIADFNKKALNNAKK